VRFSILLPTRNRLDLLKLAVQSVLDQDFDDWEIVISDNASDDDVSGFVGECGDSRIRYVRSEVLIPVTDNWNLALENSDGEYVIMLGDDDCLMRGCLSTAHELLSDHSDPDLLYTEAVQYAYPGVIPGEDEAFVQFGYCEFMRDQEEAFWLSPAEAARMVRKSMGFEYAFGYNMQHSIVSREFVERLSERGPFFQSPYPDYYATNALFLTAESILVCPWPLVAIGISPKSFGFFYINQREDEGVDFLQNVAEERLVDRAKEVVLPGPNMNTSWLLSMEALEMNFGKEYPIRVVEWKYRYMQFRILFWDVRPLDRFLKMVRELGTPGEVFFWYSFRLLVAACRLLGRRAQHYITVHALNAIHVSHPLFDLRKRTVPYASILELARAEDPHSMLREMGRDTNRSEG